jgi:hypothetical protein
LIDETSEPVASRDSEAMNARGIGLAWNGDAGGAEAAFREADRAGSSAASFNLAQLLAEQGDERGAIDAFQRAVSRGHVVAAFSLGELLAESGDMRGSIEAFTTAAERGHPRAAYELGLLYLDRGDLESATSAFARADDLGHSMAALELGSILERTGNRNGAIAAYWRAADRSVVAARARLDALVGKSGDPDKPNADSGAAGEVALPGPDALVGKSGDPDGPNAASGAAGEVALAGPAELEPLVAVTAQGWWTRRRLAWTGGTVATAAAFLVVALLAVLPSPGTSLGARTTPPTAAAHHSSPGQPSGNKGAAGRHRASATSPATEGLTGPITRARTGGVAGVPQGGSRSSSESPATGFTSEQATLLANVPDAAHARCLPPNEDLLPRADAGIRCSSSSAGMTALYYHYASRVRLRRLFHNYRAWFASRHKLRVCAGRTHGVYFQGSASSTITGRWACFYNDRTIPGSACIDWIDYALATFGSACQADGNFTALAAWWSHAGPVSSSTHGITAASGSSGAENFFGGPSSQ